MFEYWVREDQCGCLRSVRGVCLRVLCCVLVWEMGKL